MLPSQNLNREKVKQFAEKILSEKPIYLDTETTGLGKNDEIVEISILDQDGDILISSLVKPSQLIPLEVQKIHGITNEMTVSAPSWPVLWPEIRNALFGRTIAIYNAPFDLRMMQQTHQKYHLSWRETFNMLDVLLQFSNYRGEWDPFRGSMKYFKLVEAGQYFNIKLPNSHRSADDALLTRAVLHSIAGKPY
ncbi:MAG: 3'-5' exonuclease [Chloroflexi bacterium]|nr:3'-5' exonuclease [Chloroflexota bacterium]